MLTKEIQVQNKLGLHARPASKLVRAIAQGKSSVVIIKNGKRVNAKSILGVMLLEAEYGSKLVFEVTGEDEADVLENISNLFDGKFDED